jgi:MFS family permease
MSGELATPVAVKRHRNRIRPNWTRTKAMFSPVAARLSRLPSQQVALDALSELRMPGTPHPEVRLRRLLGVCAWAMLLGLIGMIIAARIVFGIFTEMPLWYWMLIFLLGVPGIAATFAAFATLHKSHLPWKLLRAASAAEALLLVATMLS